MEGHFAKILFLDLRTFLDGIKVLTIMNLYAALALIDQQTGRLCENLEVLFFQRTFPYFYENFLSFDKIKVLSILTFAILLTFEYSGRSSRAGERGRSTDKRGRLAAFSGQKYLVKVKS